MGRRVQDSGLGVGFRIQGLGRVASHLRVHCGHEPVRVVEGESVAVFDDHLCRLEPVVRQHEVDVWVPVCGVNGW